MDSNEMKKITFGILVACIGFNIFVNLVLWSFPPLSRWPYLVLGVAIYMIPFTRESLTNNDYCEDDRERVVYAACWIVGATILMFISLR